MPETVINELQYYHLALVSRRVRRFKAATRPEYIHTIARDCTLSPHDTIPLAKQATLSAKLPALYSHGLKVSRLSGTIVKGDDYFVVNET